MMIPLSDWARLNGISRQRAYQLIQGYKNRGYVIAPVLPKTCWKYIKGRIFIDENVKTG